VIVDSGAVVDLSGRDSGLIVYGEGKPTGKVSHLGCSLDSSIYHTLQRILEQKPTDNVPLVNQIGQIWQTPWI
jgi:hypothetical protein